MNQESWLTTHSLEHRLKELGTLFQITIHLKAPSSIIGLSENKLLKW